MSTFFNDAQAWLDGDGFLTLGMAGRNASATGALPASAKDATHKYALSDIWIPVGPGELISDTQPALTRVGAGSYKRTLVASTTHNVYIPFSPILRRMTGDINLASPHGVKVVSLALSYRVNTTTITSLTPAILVADLTAQTSVPAATALTVTTAGNTLTAAANQYLSITTVTTPTFLNTLDNMIVGEAVIVIPASSTVDLLGASWRVSMALY